MGYKGETSRPNSANLTLQAAIAIVPGGRSAATARILPDQKIGRSHKIKARRRLLGCKVLGLDRTKKFHVKHFWNYSNIGTLLRLV
jgi:hypothetical protein